MKQVWPAALVISSSIVSSRAHSIVPLCVSRLCLSSTVQVLLSCPLAPLACRRLPPVLLLALPSHPPPFLVVHEEEARGSAGGISAIVVFGLCGVSTTARRFPSDQLCSTSRRTLSSVLTRCSSVRSLRPALARLWLEKIQREADAKNFNVSSQLTC